MIGRQEEAKGKKLKNQFENLPDELKLECIARVPKSRYREISCLSKGFKGLVASPELSMVRSHLGVAQKNLYVAFRFGMEYDFMNRWCNLVEEDDSWRLEMIVELPSIPWNSALVTLGSSIYSFGGNSTYETGSCESTSTNFLTLTHARLPRMEVTRNGAAGALIDRNLYVIGGCSQTENWIEVFNPVKKTWTGLNKPADLPNPTSSRVAVLDNTVYLCSNDGEHDTSYVYHPKENDWVPLGECALGFFDHPFCVVNNILVSLVETDDTTTLKFFDAKEKLWNPVKGLESIPNMLSFFSGMGDFGGKLVAVGHSAESENLCVVITLRKVEKGDCFGIVESVKSISGICSFPPSLIQCVSI